MGQKPPSSGRRAVLGALATAGLLPPSITTAAGIEPRNSEIEPSDLQYYEPGSTLETSEEEFTSEDVSIESFDGTTIEATVYEPTAEGPHPAMLMTHGWGQNRNSLEGSGEAYATAGYVTLTYDSRGFGSSEGVVSLTHENESDDGSALIDWLANHENVVTEDDNNPRVGMDGWSYGGGTQTRLAAEDDRVDAIVPRAAWYNLVRALAPNDVIKEGWTRLLLDLGQQAGELEEELVERGERILEEYEVEEPEDREYFWARSPITYDQLQAPTLVIQEFNDPLFPGEEGVDVYEKATESDVESALLLGNGRTHAIGMDRPPGVSDFATYSDEAALAWLNHHVADDEDPGLAPVTYYDQLNQEFVGVDEWPPADTEPLTFSRELEEPIERWGSDSDPLIFDFPVDRKTQIFGRPSLSVTAEPLGDEFNHLFAAVRKVSDEVDRVLKYMVKPHLIEESGTLEFDLSEIESTFEPGDILQIALTTNGDTLVDYHEDAFFLFPDEIWHGSPDGSGFELSGDVSLTVSGYEDEPVDIPPIADEFDPPADHDGDGLYEDIRGTGEPAPEIADVQALYEHLYSDQVQDYAWVYNFSGLDPHNVTIFDIQALFNQL